MAKAVEGKRKFYLSAATLLAGVLFTIFGVMTGEDFTSLAIAVLVAFNGANAGVHMARAFGRRREDVIGD